MEINLKATGEQKIFNDYFKPYVLASDIDMPKMYNQGYNSYRFIGGEPNFRGIDIPVNLRSETNNYKFFESQIIVYRKDKSTCSGTYNKTLNKTTGQITESFNFD
jgi:hypothetical protein